MDCFICSVMLYILSFLSNMMCGVCYEVVSSMIIFMNKFDNEKGMEKLSNNLVFLFNFIKVWCFLGMLIVYSWIVSFWCYWKVNYVMFFIFFFIEILVILMMFELWIVILCCWMILCF